MASDSTGGAENSARRGPRKTETRDYLFGYAPRRHLLTELYGPAGPPQGVSENGLSATRLAGLGGKCRSGAKTDIAALEELGLIERRSIGQRDRFFPIQNCDLAHSLCSLIESVERTLND